MDLFINIRANNLAGQVIGQVSSQIASLRQNMTGTGQQFGIGASQATEMYRAMMAFGATQLVFQQVGQAIQFVQGAIAQGTQLQLQWISASSSFSALTGENYQTATKFIEGLNQRLSISAAALPGATADYAMLATTIQDNVIPAFQDASGRVADFQKLQNVIVSISESYGALAAGSGVDIGNTGLGLTYALGGASIAMLRQIQIFQNNPQILNFLERELAKMNVKSLQELDVRARVDLIKRAGEKFITEDFKRNASVSVDGLIQSFKSVLFDPSSGIFGLMRDLDSGTDGTQSAFSAFNESLKALIGPSGLFETMGETLAALGIGGTDPMLLLKRGLDTFTGWVRSINAALEGVQGLGASPGEALNNLVSVFSNGFDVAGMGAELAGLFNAGIRAIGQFLSQVNWQQLSSDLGVIVGQVANELTLFVASIDWGAVTQMFTAAMNGGIHMMRGALVHAAPQIALAIVAVIGALAMSLVSLIVAQQAAIWSFVAQSVINAVTTAWQAFTQFIQHMARQAIAAIASFEPPTLDISSPLTAIASAIAQFVNGLVSRARSQIASIPVVGGVVEPIARAVASPSYRGHFAAASTGSLGAALQTEMARKPLNSSLLIANSSETVLTPAQRSAYAAGARDAGRSGGSPITFAPTIVISGQTTEEQAREMLSIFSRLLEEKVKTQIA
jgi:hypothetical protein